MNSESGEDGLSGKNEVSESSDSSGKRQESSSSSLPQASIDPSASSATAKASEAAQAPTLRKFFIELLSAQGFLILVCMVCTCLWLWGDLGVSSSKNMSDAIRDHNELAQIRVPFLAWSYPLTTLAAIATGPRAALERKYAMVTFGSLMAYEMLLSLFCYGGQVLPFIGIAAPKALGIMFSSGVILVPALVTMIGAAVLFVARRIKFA